MMEAIQATKIKFALVGSLGVGKTSIAKRIEKDEYRMMSDTTIGASYFNFTVDGRIFEIWDTAGQERYRSMLPQYYRRAEVLIFVFDVGQSDTLEIMIQEYLEYCFGELGFHAENKGIIVVGNKTDMEHDPDTLTQRFRLNHYVQKRNLTYLEPIYVSAATGVGIAGLIDGMIEQGDLLAALRAGMGSGGSDMIDMEVSRSPEDGYSCGC